MKSLNYSRKNWIVASFLMAIVFVLIVNFGGQTQEEFTSIETATENAIAGSGCVLPELAAIAEDTGYGIRCIKCGGSCCVLSCQM